MTDISPTASSGLRVAQLRRALEDVGIDALLVTHPANVRYLCGFAGSTGALLVTRSAAHLVVDGRYITAAGERLRASPELQEVNLHLATRSIDETVAQVVVEASISMLGIEAAAMTLSRFHRLSAALARVAAEVSSARGAPCLQPTEGLAERLRIKKDDREVAALREAARRLSAAARDVLDLVWPGRTEQQIASDIEAALRRAGFERPAFEPIVASGPNSALPHARAGLRQLAPGDGVLLDFGGIYDGYCVDLSRTVQLEPRTKEYERLFAAVHAAHAVAIRTVAPGVPASAVDAAARNELGRRGLADAFVHGTGHGLGLELHEEPRLMKPGSGHADVRLEAGMVFTIEPGAYLPGIGGVRIEDDVLVVEAGCEILTEVPIDLTCGARGLANGTDARTGD